MAETRILTDQQKLIIAHRRCKLKKLFFSHRPDGFRLMRECQPKNIFVGDAKTPDELLELIGNWTTTVPAATEQRGDAS